MAILLPFIIIAIYFAMYLMRSDKTAACKWRQVAREGDERTWRCPVCGGEAITIDGAEPRFCGAGKPKS